jgi:hypothetical protein
MTTRNTFLLLTGSEGAEKLLEAESKKAATTINLNMQPDKMRGLTALMPSPVKDCLHVYVNYELAVMVVHLR